MFWNLPGSLLVGIGAFGPALLVLLPLHYLWGRRTPANL